MVASTPHEEDTVTRPCWDRLEEWAQAEAGAYLDAGLLPRPTLLYFEGEQATLYARDDISDTTPPGADASLRWNQLFGVGMVIHPEGVAVATPTRLRTDDDGMLVGEAEGEAAVYVGWARRRDGAEPEQGGVILTYGVDDRGGVRWSDRHELSEAGPLAPLLNATITGRWLQTDGGSRGGDQADISRAGLVYGLSRFGVSVGVARDWYARYGLDEPINPRHVRPEDRRRAHRFWQAHPSPTGASS